MPDLQTFYVRWIDFKSFNFSFGESMRKRMFWAIFSSAVVSATKPRVSTKEEMIRPGLFIHGPTKNHAAAGHKWLMRRTVERRGKENVSKAFCWIQTWDVVSRSERKKHSGHSHWLLLPTIKMINQSLQSEMNEKVSVSGGDVRWSQTDLVLRSI